MASCALCVGFGLASSDASARAAKKPLFAPAEAPEAPKLPARAATAPGGNAFVHAIWSKLNEPREKAVLREVLAGNVPDFMRQLVPVRLTMMRRGQVLHTGTVWVMPDYLSVGSDKDYVRTPLNPLTAQAIGDAIGMMLPTRHLVDEIFRQAKVKLRPSPMQAGRQMITTSYYWTHNQRIQRALAGRKPGTLTAGHKKDVVITNRLDRTPGRVAIYGWHRANGKAIQPLSTVHHVSYADYSHGIRMVLKTMVVDGARKSIEAVLRDPTLAPLLSDEGVIRRPRIRPR